MQLSLITQGLTNKERTTPVKGVGSDYWRVVEELEELIENSKQINQRTLFGNSTLAHAINDADKFMMSFPFSLHHEYS